MNATSTHPTFEHAGYTAADSIDFNARHGRTLQARAASEGFTLVWSALQRLLGHQGAGDHQVWTSGARPAACRHG